MANIGSGSKVKNKRKPMAMCDRTQMLYNFSDLEKQYEWYGDSLVWTGLMVGKDQVDVPNQNLRPYKIRPKEGQPPQNYRVIQPNVAVPPYEIALKNIIDSSNFQG